MLEMDELAKDSVGFPGWVNDPGNLQSYELCYAVCGLRRPTR